MFLPEEPHILIHPRKGRNEKFLPEKGLLLVNPSEASSCHHRLRLEGGASRFLFNSEMTVAASGSYFLAGPAIGAPMAALCMEKCIALGAKRIILFGWCGAIHPCLKIGDVVIPDLALSGEGTSRYYPLTAPAAPSCELQRDLALIYGKHDLAVQGGTVWSTDAIYREDSNMLSELRAKQGVVAVDMEFSALCTIACFRRIEFAAVLVVSDELWGFQWRPGFSKERFRGRKEKALAITQELLAGS